MATNKYIIQLIVDTGTGQAKVKGVAKAFEDLGNKAKKAKKDIDSNKKGVDDFSSSSGIAGAAAAELGRTISDLPFGIQAVTNNVSQLGSMFSLLVVKTGSARKAINSLLNVFKGPAGLLIIFQIAVAAVEFFAQAQSKAKKKTDETTESFDVQAAAVKNLIASFEISNLISQLDALNRSEEDTADAANELQKRLSQVVEYLIDKSPEFKEAFESLTPEEQISVESLKGLVKEYQNILGIRNIIKSLNEEMKDPETTDERRAEIEAEIINAELALMERLKKFKTQMSKELDTPIDTFYDFGKDSIFDIDKGFEDALKENAAKFIENLRGFNKITEKFEPEPYFPFVDPDDAALEVEIDEYFKKLKEKFDEKQKKLLDTAKTIDTITKGLNAINDVLNAQSERELTIEKNKTTAKNDELNKRLANEQLSADQRDKINQQIARNDAALVEKQNEIARKQFKRNKAFKIAMAIGETASSALKAYSSQLLPFDPTSVGRATIAAAIATAFGLAQVAAISKTKYSETPMPTPNLTSQGGGAATTAAPDFNVIGGSARSQLAEAIAGTQNGPIKAYVVSSEVSSAQELDRKIVAGASI